MHFARGRTGESADADACAALGADEFKVRLSSQKADEAYCTEDLGDALATGLAMVA